MFRLTCHPSGHKLSSLTSSPPFLSHVFLSTVFLRKMLHNSWSSDPFPVRVSAMFFLVFLFFSLVTAFVTIVLLFPYLFTISLDTEVQLAFEFFSIPSRAKHLNHRSSHLKSHRGVSICHCKCLLFSVVVYSESPWECSARIQYRPLTVDFFFKRH